MEINVANEIKICISRLTPSSFDISVLRRPECHNVCFGQVTLVGPIPGESPTSAAQP
jgi:hypothetical protein